QERRGAPDPPGSALCRPGIHSLRACDGKADQGGGPPRHQGGFRAALRQALCPPFAGRTRGNREYPARCDRQAREDDPSPTLREGPGEGSSQGGGASRRSGPPGILSGIPARGARGGRASPGTGPGARARNDHGAFQGRRLQCRQERRAPDFGGRGGMRTKLDPVTLEVIRNALPAIANEMAVDLQRTSYNMMIYEVRDFCTALVSVDGELISQN